MTCPEGAVHVTYSVGSVRDLRYTTVVNEAVRELLATDVALDKLAGRRISREEAEQLLQNRYAMWRTSVATRCAGNRSIDAS